jgi:addiction module RelE/StbE family toxin
VKALRRHKTFEKSFKKRLRGNSKIMEAFEIRLQLFLSGERGEPLYDHPLTGDMKGKRSFSVANDIRVVYEETEEEIIFLDIGSHNQVY